MSQKPHFSTSIQSISDEPIASFLSELNRKSSQLAGIRTISCTEPTQKRKSVHGVIDKILSKLRKRIMYILTFFFF